MHILGPFSYAGDELKHTQLLFISLLQGFFTAGLNQIYICLAEYAWIQGSREVVVACRVNLSSSQFPLHCTQFLWGHRAILVFSFLVIMHWWTLCISGYYELVGIMHSGQPSAFLEAVFFNEQSQGKRSCHWDILWFCFSFLTACFELWPFCTTGRSEVCWMSTRAALNSRLKREAAPYWG